MLKLRDTESSRGKIELNIGGISFSGEGDEQWLDAQITKLIEAVSSGQIDGSSNAGTSVREPEQNEPMQVGALATYLKKKGAETIQVHKFLATAAWLHRRGEKTLSTSTVSKALKDNQQKRIGNPSDCLNQNVARGFCEKKGSREFFITSEGWDYLNEESQ